ncbi:MAG: DegT/DnrJ/EryC1/StrS family aminotransferase [Planctomycetes bacterium]|nr:DegT/DnrJ/EryC1/StrS family aminotransferase [Planctomycetota bacterium]
MAVPLLDLRNQHDAMADELRGVFESTLRSGRFILGPVVEKFEADLAAYCSTRHALGVSSGTDALLLAMMAMEIGPGDEVITTPFTFFATAGCIARLGAKPVFVDIDPATFNIDPRLIEKAITPRTKAIMPVHLFGLSAEMRPIMEIASRRGLWVIEDAAQAIGARDGDAVVGSIGDVGCLSFYPSKNLSAMGDAGAVTTTDAALHARMKMLRLHGEETKYHHTYVGGNFRIDALQAGFLGAKLPRLDAWAERRRENAGRYDKLLVGTPLVTPAWNAPGKHHVVNQYTLRVPGGKRDALRQHLVSKQIGCEVYYPVPLHVQKCFAYLGYKAGDFPHSERAAAEVLSVPIYPELTAGQQEEVAGAIREFYQL